MAATAAIEKSVETKDNELQTEASPLSRTGIAFVPAADCAGFMTSGIRAAATAFFSRATEYKDTFRLHLGGDNSASDADAGGLRGYFTSGSKECFGWRRGDPLPADLADAGPLALSAAATVGYRLVSSDVLDDLMLRDRTDDKDERSIMMLFHYPGGSDMAALCPPHVDKGVMTLVDGGHHDEGAELEVCCADGTWRGLALAATEGHAAKDAQAYYKTPSLSSLQKGEGRPPGPGLCCFAGATLARAQPITPAVVHRVSPGTFSAPRVSVVFKMRAHHDALLPTLGSVLETRLRRRRVVRQQRVGDFIAEFNRRNRSVNRSNVSDGGFKFSVDASSSRSELTGMNATGASADAFFFTTTVPDALSSAFGAAAPTADTFRFGVEEVDPLDKSGPRSTFDETKHGDAEKVPSEEEEDNEKEEEEEEDEEEDDDEDDDEDGFVSANDGAELPPSPPPGRPVREHFYKDPEAATVAVDGSNPVLTQVVKDSLAQQPARSLQERCLLALLPRLAADLNASSRPSPAPLPDHLRSCLLQLITERDLFRCPKDGSVFWPGSSSSSSAEDTSSFYLRAYPARESRRTRRAKDGAMRSLIKAIYGLAARVDVMSGAGGDLRLGIQPRALAQQTRDGSSRLSNNRQVEIDTAFMSAFLSQSSGRDFEPRRLDLQGRWLMRLDSVWAALCPRRDLAASLTMLDLSNMPLLSSDSLASLPSRAPFLRDLRLRHTRAAQGLAAVAQLQCLRALDLSDPIIDEGDHPLDGIRKNHFPGRKKQIKIPLCELLDEDEDEDGNEEEEEEEDEDEDEDEDPSFVAGLVTLKMRGWTHGASLTNLYRVLAAATSLQTFDADHVKTDAMDDRDVQRFVGRFARGFGDTGFFEPEQRLATHDGERSQSEDRRALLHPLLVAPSLTDLDISQPPGRDTDKCTRLGLNYLCHGRPSKLRRLVAQGLVLSRSELLELQHMGPSRLNSLTFLDLSFCSGIDALAPFVPPNLPALQHLALRGCRGIASAENVRIVKECLQRKPAALRAAPFRLRVLDLRECGLTLQKNASAVKAAKLPARTRATIVGLRSTSGRKLNGKPCRIVRFIPSTKRYACVLADDGGDADDGPSAAPQRGGNAMSSDTMLIIAATLRLTKAAAAEPTTVSAPAVYVARGTLKGAKLFLFAERSPFVKLKDLDLDAVRWTGGVDGTGPRLCTLPVSGVKKQGELTLRLDRIPEQPGAAASAAQGEMSPYCSIARADPFLPVPRSAVETFIEGLRKYKSGAPPRRLTVVTAAIEKSFRAKEKAMMVTRGISIKRISLVVESSTSYSLEHVHAPPNAHLANLVAIPFRRVRTLRLHAETLQFSVAFQPRGECPAVECCIHETFAQLRDAIADAVGFKRSRRHRLWMEQPSLLQQQCNIGAQAEMHASIFPFVCAWRRDAATRVRRSNRWTQPTTREEKCRMAPTVTVWDLDASFTVRVKDQTGEETYFQVKPTTKMGRVFGAYAERKGVPQNSLRFLLDGHRIGADETPRSLNLIHHDQIDCLLEQSGD